VKGKRGDLFDLMRGGFGKEEEEEKGGKRKL
jgi:hypothetical protein